MRYSGKTMMNTKIVYLVQKFISCWGWLWIMSSLSNCPLLLSFIPYKHSFVIQSEMAFICCLVLWSPVSTFLCRPHKSFLVERWAMLALTSCLILTSFTLAPCASIVPVCISIFSTYVLLGMAIYWLDEARPLLSTSICCSLLLLYRVDDVFITYFV